MFVRILTIVLIEWLLFATPAHAVQSLQFGTAVPMTKKGTSTFYVPVGFDGVAGNELMVDTGSDYVTINQTTLDALKARGKVDYVKQVGGVMADGSDVNVSIYRIANLSIGCCCIVHDVEAAVFEGTDRQILGLSALKKVAPFALSLDPAHLMLSDCKAQSADLAKN
ncbi:retroviral-like aspartic protease family protein [Methylomonas sp. SURF-1]|uniref:Retroviral-like aspartic protease family protein n=1 Tax=Methylomonas aurea TaxID=2952224 RepID=A0ABT1UHZ3_9GAMM|nr:retropepsin-like aspartic protease [Methylomonas sp. SURF-1]MCQ8181845.1 retroviral-like aspartic protease family protein [Methylomonas sp. SURF-1]